MEFGSLAPYDAARLGISAGLFGLGFACIAAGLMGLWRFPDFYTRQHAVNVSDYCGALFVLAGLGVASGDLEIIAKLAVLGFLVAAAGPGLAQLAGNSAHAAGLAPLSGPYAARRPGSGRGQTT